MPQMQEHGRHDSTGYKAKIRKRLNEPKPGAYTACAREPPADYRVEPLGKSTMARYSPGSLSHRLDSAQKPDSDHEQRKPAAILERNTLEWPSPREGNIRTSFACLRQVSDRKQKQRA